MKQFISLLLILLSFSVNAQTNSSLKLALLKYSGGGNWYVSPTALPNLIEFCNKNLNTDINPVPATVVPGSSDIFNYPFIHLTGNGNIYFSAHEAQNLRKYLLAGGFLSINDSYGLDKFIRREMKKIFPNKEFVPLPVNFPIYHMKYDFPDGLPKIHKHDGKSPVGYGIFYEGKLVVFYNYESDLGDGWEDPDVHHDPQYKRLQALKMGANIIQYAFMN